MYVDISRNDFVSWFDEIRPEQFSYDALHALFDYYEEIEEATGEPMKLDVIAICCEWTEYESLAEFRKDYGEDYECIADIENDTTVIEFDGRFLVQQF